MRCPKCSVSVTRDTASCPRCGEDLQPTATETTVRTAAPTRTPTPVRRLRFHPGDEFAGRYTIVEQAGAGGMGVVFKAIDTSLRLTVALKLIQPDLVGLKTFVERFKNEVRLTRQITHPNVCRVHDLGESGGILYLSMDWVAGVTLRQLLNQAGTLNTGRALQIAGKIAAALQAAHEKGIIHRDLKPENVMIDDRGEVFVMDFGIAVGSDSVKTEGAAHPGGTPAYMAPEQKRGEGVDRRTDLYALGLILQEMLTGQTPVRDRGIRVELDPETRRQMLPVLGKLLAEERDRRFDSAEAAGQALHVLRGNLSGGSVARWVRRVVSGARPFVGWAGATLILLGAVLGYYALRTDGSATRLPLPPGSPAYGLYERGLHYLREEVETPRGLDDAIQMFHRAKTAEPDFALAWAGLGEAYWIRFERTGETSSRDEARGAVREAFLLDPDLPEAHLARARGLIVEARHDEARVDLEKATRSKPDFAQAWAYLGIVHREMGNYAPGLDALRRAIELQPGVCQYHVDLGLFFERFAEYDQAAGAYRKAIEVKPESTMGWNNLGTVLFRLSRLEEAIEAFRRSIAIEDRASPRSNLGTAYYLLGRYDEAAESYRRAAELQPGQAIHWGNLGDALAALAHHDEARDAYLHAVGTAREAVNTRPRSARARERLGLYCAKAGEEECAVDEGGRAATLQPGNAEFVFSNAVIRCLLGRDEEALDWLERAAKMGFSKVEIEMEPALEPLHQHPRYRRILELAG